MAVVRIKRRNDLEFTVPNYILVLAALALLLAAVLIVTLLVPIVLS